MKKSIFIITTIIIISLTACAGASSTEEANVSGQVTPPSLMADALNLDFDDAASLRTQLAYGTLKLQESNTPITSEDAKSLLPLWQAILVLENNPDSADQELTAVQDQIILSMKSEQLEAIAAMQITNAELTIFYTEQGLTIPTPNPDSTLTSAVGGGGKNSGLTTEEKEATKTAAEALGTPVGTNAGSSGSDRKNILTASVIELLTVLANQ